MAVSIYSDPILEKKENIETTMLENDFIKEFDQGNFSHFLKEFHILCNTPSKPRTKIKNEDSLRKGFVEFSNRFRFENAKAESNGKPLTSLEDYPYIKIAKENHLLLLYALHSLRAYDAEGLYWAKLRYPHSIEQINDPKILFSMLENLKDFQTFFTLYPQYNNDEFLLSEDIISLCGNARGFYEYLKNVYGEIPAKMKGILILNAIQKLSPQSYGSEKGLKNLHFLLSNGFQLHDVDEKFGKWYSKIQWYNLGEQDAFLFEYIEKSSEKKEIIEYISTHFPNIVVEHYLKGNFFIGNQLIVMGLPAPKIEIESYLINAIENGLQRSKELKKYEALLLVAQGMGILSEKEFKIITEQSKSGTSILSKIKEVISQVVKHFMTLYAEIVDDTPHHLNAMMRIIEQTYTVALATLYNLPVVNCESDRVQCYRGISLLKSSINDKFLQHIFEYGHAANFYGFLGAGYNRDVYEEIIDGPRMAWNCWSDTTCITPDIDMALNFSVPDPYHDAYVLSIEYRTGQPLFFGNWLTVGYDDHPKLPMQFEVPHIAPQTIEALYRVEGIRTKHSIVEELYKSNSHPHTFKRRNCDSESMAKNKESCDKYFAQVLEPHHPQIHFPYRDFYQQRNNLLFTRVFNQYQRKFEIPSLLPENWQAIHHSLASICNFTPEILRGVLNYLSSEGEDFPESTSSPLVIFSSGLKTSKREDADKNISVSCIKL